MLPVLYTWCVTLHLSFVICLHITLALPRPQLSWHRIHKKKTWITFQLLFSVTSASIARADITSLGTAFPLHSRAGPVIASIAEAARRRARNADALRRTMGVQRRRVPTACRRHAQRTRRWLRPWLCLTPEPERLARFGSGTVRFGPGTASNKSGKTARTALARPGRAPAEKGTSSLRKSLRRPPS